MNKLHGRYELISKNPLKINSQIILVVLAILFLSTTNAFAAKPKKDFDHSTTGFVLTGPHERLECNTCHLRGMFKGIPRQCVSCHDRGSQIGTTQKPLNHVQTSGDCETCHAGSTWAVTRFDHSGVMGTCKKCHNNVTATGKSAKHVRSNDSCDDCHITTAWIPARFDHANVTGTCFSCHNGVEARGKHTLHVTSSNSCDTCHSTNAWIPARFDHSNVSGSCFSCHNGTTAKGKLTNHLQSNNVCDDCHLTSAWIPARFNHDAVTNPCFSCHNGSIAEGKIQSHVASSNICDDCHKTSGWLPATYDHASAGVVSTTDCTTCHSSDFDPKKHLKTENPSKVYYTSTELNTCASSECHLYQDNTYTVITESRPGGSKHSETRTSW